MKTTCMDENYKCSCFGTRVVPEQRESKRERERETESQLHL